MILPKVVYVLRRNTFEVFDVVQSLVIADITYTISHGHKEINDT